MVPLDKYVVMGADSYDARKRHRILVEEALAQGNLPKDLRVELERELRVALDKELVAQHVEEDSEEEKKKKGEGGDASGGGDQQSGSTGGTSGGSGDGEGSAGGMRDGGDALVRVDSADIEWLPLLMFLAENDISQPHVSEPVFDVRESLAAATILFDREQQTAEVREPYMLEAVATPHSPSQFIPTLERYAATSGARVMQLRVQPEAVAHFVAQHGYQPQGRAYRKNGAMLQRMRKNLSAAMIPQNDGDV